MCNNQAVDVSLGNLIHSFIHWSELELALSSDKGRHKGKHQNNSGKQHLTLIAFCHHQQSRQHHQHATTTQNHSNLACNYKFISINLIVREPNPCVACSRFQFRSRFRTRDKQVASSVSSESQATNFASRLKTS